MAGIGFNTIGSWTSIPQAYQEVYSAAIEHEALPYQPFLSLAYTSNEILALSSKSITFTKMKNIPIGQIAPLLEDKDVPSVSLEGANYTMSIDEHGLAVMFTDKAIAFNNGPVSIQREITAALGTHYGQYVNRMCMNAALATGNTLYSNRTARADMVTGDTLTTSLINKAVAQLSMNMAPRYEIMTPNRGLVPVYICVAHPLQLADLKNDPHWENADNYQMKDKVFSGAIGMWNSVVFIESGEMPCGITGSINYDATLHAATTSGKDVAKAVILGDGCFAFGAKGPVAVRQDVPRDFGRKNGYAWMRIMGAHAINPDFGLTLETVIDII